MNKAIRPDRTAVVTGLGLMSGLGLDLESSWNGLLEGVCPARRFRQFDPTGLASDFGVELPAGADEIFQSQIRPRSRAQMSRATMIALATAAMAIDDAGVLEGDQIQRDRIGVVLGTAGSGYAGTPPDDYRILRNMVSAPAAWISLKWKLQGPSHVVSTACSSGAYALHAAIRLIESGECDTVICGAADSSINYPDVAGFCSLMALSEECSDPSTASRPFDLKRSGFVIGEGGGMMVLESAATAQARGARVYAAVSAPGLTSEGFNILSPEPDGRGMARCMKRALDMAGLLPGDIGYINAHGTSTHLNDLYEVQAIKTVFGDRATRIPVSSTKSMTGHCLGAAASVEAVICCKSLAENVVPPTANLDEPDPAFGLDFVTAQARPVALQHIMSNSFAFGGQNGVCIFSRISGT